jgi:hypothetical protein
MTWVRSDHAEDARLAAPACFQIRWIFGTNVHELAKLASEAHGTCANFRSRAST